MWSSRVRLPAARCLRDATASASSFARRRAAPAPSRGPRNTIRRPPPIRRDPGPSDAPAGNTGAPVENYDPAQNTLLSPVYIPEDPNGVLKEAHPATGILANSGLVVQRQLELMNVMIGFEQANKYVILDAAGNHVGYMAEQEKGIASMMARQWFRTHRGFVTHVFDRHENEVLRFHRPFSWINSRIRVYDPVDAASHSAYSPSAALQYNNPSALAQAADPSNARLSQLGLDQMRVIGEAQQQWAPLRRKYNLFTYHHSPNPATDMGTQQIPLAQTGLSNAQQTQLAHASERGDLGEYSQFAYVDEPFLSWDFSLRSADSHLIGSVNRDFVGFAREIFTDTGVYALRMDSAALKPAEEAERNTSITGMTLDQRAVMLATAVSIDFDYFSRHSGSGGLGFFPMWFPGLGGDLTAGGAAGGAAAGEAGAVGEAAAGTLGRGAAGSMAEGAAAGAVGAGTIAGVDVMRNRGEAAQNQAQDGAPSQPPADQHSHENPQVGPYGDIWAPEEKHDDQSSRNPWSDSDGEDGGDGGDGNDWSDFF